MLTLTDSPHADANELLIRVTVLGNILKHIIAIQKGSHLGS